MPPPADRPQASVKILLVEDAVEDALIVQILLRKAGNFVTVHCQDGDRAVELLGSQGFDLVLTDLNLPGFDGFDLTNYVKENHPEVPVLVITGYQSPEYAERAKEAGAARVLLKPVDRDELLRAVRELLDISREERNVGVVVAVGARPGDIELGCCGTLLAHRDRGDSVILLLLEKTADVEMEQVYSAAQVLGARVLIPEAEGEDMAHPDSLAAFIAGVVKEVKPHAAYIPAVEDDAPDRRRAHRLAFEALDSVPNVVSYVTATTGLGFRPSRFVNLGGRMTRKHEVLSMYRDSGRRDLSDRFADALARYWGRFADFSEVEPLNVIRSGSE